jgi:hypothetical protein
MTTNQLFNRNNTMTNNTLPPGWLPSSNPTVLFEDNHIGRMKKEIFEADEAQLDAVLTEYGMAQGEVPPVEWSKPGSYIQMMTGRQVVKELGLVAGSRLGDIIRVKAGKPRPTRVLILGVSGFIGNALVERLLDDGGYEIYGMDLQSDNIERFIAAYMQKGGRSLHIIDGSEFARTADPSDSDYLDIVAVAGNPLSADKAVLDRMGVPVDEVDYMGSLVFDYGLL